MVAAKASMSEQRHELQRSYFDLFSLPQVFRIDTAALDRAYREVQTQVHPDRYISASDAEQRAAMQCASHANEAYRTLKQPLARAHYILQLQGMSVAAVVPPEFLMQQMEWREAVEQAESAHDTAALAHLADEVRQAMQRSYDDLERQLDLERNWPAAAQNVAGLMFMDKLRAEISDALETLDV